MARNQHKEIYIVAGVAGNSGIVKNEGIITIPVSVWKVALILPRGQGLPNVTTAGSAQVVAVIMPNVPGIRNIPWETCRITVDAVETLGGYSLLDLLRDDIERALESNTKPPVAVVDGSFSSIEGESVPRSAVGTTDPDGDALTYRWEFGDGATATGITTSHVYNNGGNFTVRLIATDIRGLADTAITTASMSTASQALGSAAESVEQLVGTGRVNRGIARSLEAKIDPALASMARGQRSVAVNQLQALLNQLDALVRSNGLTSAQAAPTRSLVSRVMASLSR